LRAGGASLLPEVARHVDVSVAQKLPLDASLQVTVFARSERDVLWTPEAEPRRLSGGGLRLGRGDAPWINGLDGDARGVELVFRRDAPAGLSGWAAYAHNRLEYTDVTTGARFPSDVEQRHAVSLFGHYRVSNRSTVGAKFRYGSNYPRVGYFAAQEPPPGTPRLLGDSGVPLFIVLSDSRNGLRLPAYARLDLRADRAFVWGGRRLTLFVEVANVLNRRNVRNVPYGFDRTGRVFGGTDSMLPVLPSAGFVVDF